MSYVDYTYAVARIRAMEMTLFSSATIEQLMGMKSYESCIQFLTEKGWGDSSSNLDAEGILAKEDEKTWSTIRELLKDKQDVLDIFSYPKLFHNLKSAIKESVDDKPHGNIYFDDCAMNGEYMRKIVRDKDFSSLPDFMREAGKEAYETFLHTRDGQLCDIIVDHAALVAIYEAGKKAQDSIIRDYAESTVAVANIKIAVRSQRTAKSLEFMKRSMAECDSLNIDRLMAAALSGMDAICDFLAGTKYAGGAEALKTSASAFECWCDNQMIETMKPQKYNPFSVGPLVAYVIARQNEIKTVRMILTGKLNDLPEQQIRERIREMYV